MAYEYYTRERWDSNPPPMSAYSYANHGAVAIIHHTADSSSKYLKLEGKPGPKWYSMLKRGTASLATRRAINKYEKRKKNIVAQEMKAMRNWKAYHQSMGWVDIGYHLIIFPSGHVYEGRPANTQGAHARGANHQLGISFAGNFENDKPTKQALYAFNIIKQERKVSTLIGHYKVPGNYTACPGKNLKAALGV